MTNATAQSIKYIITDSQISFYKDNEVRTIHSCSGLKDVLYGETKRCLLEGEEIPVFSTKEAIKLLRTRPEFSAPINKRIKALEEAGLPTEPLHQFLENCPDHLLENIELLSKVGTSAMPLTWDGNVVLYQRSNYFNGATSSTWTSDSEFVSGRVVDAQQSVSSFDSIVDGTCPDAGPVFEVVVQAQDIIDVTSNNFWKVKKLTQMSRLGLRPAANTKSDSGIVEFLTNCVGGSAAAVRVPYNAGTAAKMINSLFTHSTEALNNIVPVRSAVAFC